MMAKSPKSEDTSSLKPAEPAASDGYIGPDRGNAKVRQLLEAAHSLFLEQSYDAVSTDAIAKAAKVSKATLYVYFSSKEALFSALVSDRCSQIAHDIWNSATDSDDVEPVLRKIAANFLAMFATPDALSLYRSILGQVTRFPELGHMFHESGPKILQARIANFLSDATKRGQIDIPDAPLAALQFLQLISADIPLTGLLALKPLTLEDMERTAESGIALFLAGYGAAPSARSKPLP